VYLKLGNIHYRRGGMDEARAAWERALGIEPGNRIVRANLEALYRAHPPAGLGAAGNAALVGHAA